jgi:quercetin 2,3-dioxygenase
MSNRTVRQVINPPKSHWVGDAFKVHGFIPQVVPWELISPFVILDYGAKTYFEPSEHLRGVGSHPHRGFETVTIAYRGEVEHHDSRGNYGIIGEGEVQWMTAGKGILHKEYHSENFAKTGGEMQMVQLWVNLPAKDKMTEPKYQGITRDEIVKVALPNDSGRAEIIAGSFEDGIGPASSFTPINLWNLHLNEDSESDFEIPNIHNCALLVLEGEIVIDGNNIIENQMVLMNNDGNSVHIKANQKSVILLMSGEPINEPIEAYGPFLMNTKKQLVEAIEDFNAGKFGDLD